MILTFDEDESLNPRRSRKGKFLLFLFLAIFPLSSTLAANINIGGSKPLEFGQGVQRLVSCAPSTPITLRPISSFVNQTGSAGNYYFSGISLEGIQNSCIGYDFIIKAYGETGSALAIFDTNKDTIRVYQSGNGTFSASAGDRYSFTQQSFGSFGISFDTPVSIANSVYRLTIETAAHDATMVRYSIGDTGPNGGMIVILPTTPGNSTGQYFEAKQVMTSGVWCDVWPIDISGATGTAIGTGASNTSAILNFCGAGAAFTTSYGPGFSGTWFLPSTDELAAAFAAGFTPSISNWYWTSTQYDGDDAYAVAWPSGTVLPNLKISGLTFIGMSSFS